MPYSQAIETLLLHLKGEAIKFNEINWKIATNATSKTLLYIIVFVTMFDHAKTRENYTVTFSVGVLSNVSPFSKSGGGKCKSYSQCEINIGLPYDGSYHMRGSVQYSAYSHFGENLVRCSDTFFISTYLQVVKMSPLNQPVSWSNSKGSFIFMIHLHIVTCFQWNVSHLLMRQ